VIGCAIIIADINPLYNVWLLISFPISIIAIFKLPKDFIIYKKEEFLTNHFLRLALIVLILFSFIVAAINIDLTIIPSFLLVSSLTAYYYNKNKDLYNKYFKIIAYLGSIAIFLKFFLLGKSLNDVLLFSKNMIPLIFVPYIYNFVNENSVKKRNLTKILDNIIVFFLIVIFILTLSIANIIFSLIIISAIISPKEIGIAVLFRQKIFLKFNFFCRFLAFLGLVYLAIRYISNLTYEFVYPYLAYIPALVRGYWTGGETANPRLGMLQDYFNFDNFYQIIFGKHIKVFEYFDITQFSYDELVNPHNSAIILHNTCGIFGLIIIPVLIFASIKILFNNSTSMGIFFLAILFRSSTDSILLASGVSSFIIYLSVFDDKKSLNKYI
jgi:hypothetical protein